MTALFPLTLGAAAFVVAAIVLGFFFGFFLERAGFGSSLKLTSQFYFRDWSVLKVMFTAIVVAMLGLIALTLAGWLDMGAVYVPDAFVGPQIVGGLLLGAGFILGGFCPGTSVAAAATGKLDGLAFIGGILFGIFAFGLAEPAIHGFNMSGGLGPLTLPQWLNTTAGVVAFFIVVVAVGAFWAAEKSEGDWQLFNKTYGKSVSEGDK
jgi:uncharacterized membrane protein YedE/YeeE